MRTKLPALASVFFVLCVAGCCHQQTQSITDPFLGQTTVPPPGTGQAGAIVPPNPYDASAAGFVPPAVAAPPAGAPVGTYAPQTSPYVQPPTTYAPSTTSPYQTPYQPPPVTAPAYRQGRWRPSTSLGAVESGSAENVTTTQHAETTAALTMQSGSDGTMATTAGAVESEGSAVQPASFRDPRGFDQLSSPGAAAGAGEEHVAPSEESTEPATESTDSAAVEPYDLDAALAAAEAGADLPVSPTQDARQQVEVAYRSDSSTALSVADTVGDANVGLDESAPRQFTRRWQSADAVAPQQRPGATALQTVSWASPFPADERGAGTSLQFVSTGTSSLSGAAVAGDVEYGHDHEYRRLQGVLEHSRATEQWKLRYIPIDGETDVHGGSVRLDGGSLLGEFRNGEAVTVEGHIGTADPVTTGDSSYAPAFHVDAIHRQGA